MGDDKALLSQIFEYRELLHDLGRLAPEQKGRFQELEQQLATGELGAGWRYHERSATSVAATLKVGDQAHPVTVVDASGGGVCVRPAPAMIRGQRALLCIDSSPKGVYEVEARWHRADDSTMGMPFVGPQWPTPPGS